MELAARIEPKLWNSVDGMTVNQAGRLHLDTASRQKRKFEKLPSRMPVRHLDVEKVVINKSSTTLTPDALSVLAKGGNFATTLRCISTEEIINGIEVGIQSLGNY